MFALAAALLVAPAFAPQPPEVEFVNAQPPRGGFGFGGRGGLDNQGAYGGGGFGGPAAPDESPTGETFVQGPKVGVLISPDGTQVWGWSHASGKMTPLPIDVPEAERGKVYPIVGQDVAAVAVGGVAYFYGGSSGKWGSHPIGDRKDAASIVGINIGAIHTADGVYAYSGVTGTGGLHPLDTDARTDGPSVGIGYVKVASDRGFGMFSAETGTWGSVRYEQPAE